MDAVTRQASQHQEYEPEWETAFYIQLRLANVVQLILKWCATNKNVFVQTFRATLAKIRETSDPEKTEMVKGSLNEKLL